MQARLSAVDFFAVIDENNDGLLNREEFHEFWRKVKQRGTSDDEIIVMLEMTEQGEMWVGLDPCDLDFSIGKENFETTCVPEPATE